MLQESAEIKRRNAKLSDYYENLRTNVFSILGKNSTNKNIIFYNNCWCPEWNAIIYKRLDMNYIITLILYKSINTFTYFIAGPKPVMRGGEGDNCSQEKYDSYLTKLQNICTEQVGEETGPGGNNNPVKPVTESLKSALQNISVLPTPTW